MQANQHDAGFGSMIHEMLVSYLHVRVISDHGMTAYQFKRCDGARAPPCTQGQKVTATGEGPVNLCRCPSGQSLRNIAMGPTGPIFACPPQ